MDDDTQELKGISDRSAAAGRHRLPIIISQNNG
jgi:hypothetical protein